MLEMREMFLPLTSSHLARGLAIAATRQLSLVDYNVANRVTETVADIVALAYAHDMPMAAHWAVSALWWFDDAGSALIALVAYIVNMVN